MLKFDWCAVVSTRAGPWLLTIVRTDSIVTTRSVANSTFQTSPHSVIFANTQADLGHIEGDRRSV